MIGFSRTQFLPVPKGIIGPNSGIAAELGGESVGDTRTVNLVTITNNKAYAVGFEIEQESNKAPVSATIQPGETVLIQLSPIVTYWRDTSPTPGWNGLNIRWKEPA